MSTTLSVSQVIEPDALAAEISDQAVKWAGARREKERQWGEVRSYVFATDTKTTSNASLPWRNSTTRPKLCQIRDNLHANYMAALFPTEQWFRWMGANEESATAKKAKAVEAYMTNKLREVKFKEYVSRALYDYIDYGNVFGDVEYVTELTPQKDGTSTVAYIGPRPVRISPMDIWFNITSPTFKQTPKIRRVLMSMGDLAKHISILSTLDAAPYKVAFERLKKNRSECSLASDFSDHEKTKRFVADGFGTLSQYYDSGMVELLIFEGDLYSSKTTELLVNHRIVVMDRAYVVEKTPLTNWLGCSTIVHVGWRLRPDNLMAMGPLDNLVGMQYRIDHLENLKADVFDQIAFPIYKQKGYVEDWKPSPGERIFMNEDADVEALTPDPTALNADMQILELEAQMEEMAGAPKQAMGIRTPGEKTAFEVQALENGAGRIFQSKIAHFEEHFIEPLLNAMLETACRNMNASEVIRVVDDDFGVVEFMTITKDDITAKGRLTPQGARHFASQNRLVQNLTQLSGTPLYQDPAVNVHLSGLKMAKLIVDAMALGNYDLVTENVRVAEQMETQKFVQSAQEQVMGTGMVPTDPLSDEVGVAESPDEMAVGAPNV
jgi:hypothetical protein